MLIAILVVLNIPLYIFLGWLAFDTKQNAVATFADTITAVLKTVLVPQIVRVMLGMDTSGSLGLVPIAGYFFACGGMVYGEYVLITQWFPGL